MARDKNYMEPTSGTAGEEAGNEKLQNDQMATTGDRHDVQPTPLFGSSRMALAILGFFGFINLYALRINMSVAMVCMVNRTAFELSQPVVDGLNLSDSTTTELAVTGGVTTTTGAPTPDQCDAGWGSSGDDSVENSGEFAWDKETQGVILSAFFWGYLFTQIPGGYLAERFGGKRVMGYCMLVVALATLLSPVAARTSHYLLIVLRIIKGLGQGVVWPCMIAMWAHWAPPLERTKLIGFTYAGAQIGNVITLPVSALLCEYGFDGGWPAVFYVLGGLGVLWCVLWLVLVFDSPGQHPRISARERSYIEASLTDQMEALRKRREGESSTPWRAIFTSGAVWAIIVAQTCSDWETYTLLTQLPTFMKEVLKFDIQSNGLFSAIPYIAFWLFINITGWMVDFIRRRRLLSTTNVRKLCQVLSSVVSAAFLIGTGYVHCSQPLLAVALLTLGVAFMGLQYGAYIPNHVDVAPRYAGVLFGIANTASTISGITAPYAVGVITQNSTQEEWLWVFYVTAAICVFGAIFYVIFASGEVQSWAVEPKDVSRQHTAADGQEMALLNRDGREMSRNVNV